MESVTTVASTTIFSGKTSNIFRKKEWQIISQFKPDLDVEEDDDDEDDEGGN